MPDAPTAMRAADVMAAVRRKYPESALVPKLVIRDEEALGGLHEHYEQGAEREPLERRIDALMFTGLQRTAIEIKVSKADAARESWAKVRAWRRVTHRFVYVVPAALIEFPPVYGAGLWYVHPDGRIDVKRKATVNTYAEPLPQLVVANIAHRASRLLAGGGSRG